MEELIKTLTDEELDLFIDYVLTLKKQRNPAPAASQLR